MGSKYIDELSEIKLEENEKHIRDLVLKVCDYINSHELDEKGKKLNIVPRISGGWVRDKLLGRKTSDIDITLNCMTGYDFAMQVGKYMKLKLKRRSFEMKDKDICKDGEDKNNNLNYKEKNLSGYKNPGSGIVHKIMANPEKSKHLETATMLIYNQQVDFVNLRAEVYDNKSRIPTETRIGTPLEDAERRDATLNALFYNLYTNSVEDYTKRGIDDLKAGILRTPVDPLKTFLDDPLRVLRLIRFAAKFQFKIEANTYHAMQNLEVKEALRDKVSPERIGMEITKTFESDYPSTGLHLINDLDLWKYLFTSSSSTNEDITKNIKSKLGHHIEIKTILNLSVNTTQEVLDFWDKFVEKYDSIKLYTPSLSSGMQKLIVWLLVSMIPIIDMNPIQNPCANQINSSDNKKLNPTVTEKEDKNKSDLMIQNVLKNNLRLSNNVVKTTLKFTCKNARDYIQLANEARQNKANDISEFKLKVAMFIRELGSCWPSLFASFAVYHNIVLYANEPKNDLNKESHEDIAIKSYESLLELIKRESLWQVYDLKPVVNGKTLVRLLGKPPGRWVAKAIQHILVLQITDPTLTEDALLEKITNDGSFRKTLTSLR